MKLTIEARYTQGLPKVAHAAHDAQCSFQVIAEVLSCHHSHGQNLGWGHLGIVFEQRQERGTHLRENDINGDDETVGSG